MGSIIGGVVGGIGSLVGGMSSKSGANKAQGLDLTGYNYLTKGGGADFTNTAAANGVSAGNRSQDIQNQEGQLLGTQPITAQTKSAFNNYLGSTGYNFQMDQGTRAITGSASARGLRDSGDTAKALTKFGQGMGSNYFSSYMGQLGNLNGQAATTVNQGQAAVGAAGAAGSAGGQAAGQAAQNGGNAQGNALDTAFNQVGSAVGNNFSTIKNWFG